MNLARHIAAAVLLCVFALLALLCPSLLQNPKQTPPK